MKINLDKFFLGILWLLTITLATTFWMNIKYGFNIFSSTHWAYLSEIQASRAPVRDGFYLSLIVAILVGIIGLYICIRPRFRKIPLPVALKQPDKISNEQKPMETPSDKTVAPQNTPVEDQPTKPMPVGLTRPLSPVSGTALRVTPQHQIAPVANTMATSTQPNSELNKKIGEIFAQAGYIVKPCKAIGALQSPAIAVGYDQSVWIGVTNKSPQETQGAIDTLVSFFSDTLGETAADINVNACIVNPSGNAEDTSDAIHLFSTLDKLDQFMAENNNKEPEDFEPELFDAFSSYIDTVMNYIGKH